MTTPALGRFLRARRDATTPQSVGLRGNARRRVPGLRREEVAMLADVSVDYHVRLEQGRETGPSAQVLDALADALALDDDGRGHLYRLAGLAPRPRADLGTRRVDPHLLRLMDSWPDTPVLVTNAAYDVLAHNSVAALRLAQGGHRSIRVSVRSSTVCSGRARSSRGCGPRTRPVANAWR